MTEEIHQQLAAAVSAYRMPDAARQLVARSRLVIVCGVTAAGKNTIVNALIEQDDFAYIVSHTTRPPRENHGKLEQNGRDYWFVDEPKMLELVQNEAFVEVKQVHGTTFYGTSVMAIKQAVQSGKRPITELDVQGAQELMAELPDFRPLFILPPSYDIWMERLANRGVLSDDERRRRLTSARMELQLAIDNPQFALLVNRDFHETVAAIRTGVDTAEAAQAGCRELARTLLQQIDRI